MKKGNITGGLLLILLGVWFLAIQFIPELKQWAEASWALSIIGIGAIFLFVSVVTNIAGLSIPAFIIGGIGGLLHYQNVTGNWESWAYAWSLIPGFVGLGVLFYGLQIRDKNARSAGFILLFISTLLFFIFGSFLGAPKEIIRFWPLILIFVGLRSLFRSLFDGKKAKSVPSKEKEEEFIEDETVLDEVEVLDVEENTDQFEGEENEN